MRAKARPAGLGKLPDDAVEREARAAIKVPDEGIFAKPWNRQ